MKYRKILMIAIGLISVFVLMGTAQAFNWFGFSELCFECVTKGSEGEIIEVTITSMTVNAQCYNINTGNFDQPGAGNYGNLILKATTDPVDPTKLKGVIEIGGCLDLSRWGDHDKHLYEDDHLCWPFDNKNKEEWCVEDESGECVELSVYVSELEASWVWKDANGRVINTGTDKCTWSGEIIDGIPQHDIDFDCTSETLKKLDCNFKLKE